MSENNEPTGRYTWRVVASPSIVVEVLDKGARVRTAAPTAPRNHHRITVATVHRTIPEVGDLGHVRYVSPGDLSCAWFEWWPGEAVIADGEQHAQAWITEIGKRHTLTQEDWNA